MGDFVRPGQLTLFLNAEKIEKYLTEKLYKIEFQLFVQIGKFTRNQVSLKFAKLSSPQ